MKLHPAQRKFQAPSTKIQTIRQSKQMKKKSNEELTKLHPVTPTPVSSTGQALTLPRREGGKQKLPSRVGGAGGGGNAHRIFLID
ncbi:MAG: hypothetical protein C4530_02705 [Desulfobacteraceae bacterium]|nr:MAG: hypothetical protein C4530_02705 [Desulfobacteraceae bacterium]